MKPGSTSLEKLAIPALRLGREYDSLETAALARQSGGESVAELGLVNAGLIRRDALRLDAAARALRAIPVARLLKIFAQAGELFLHGELPLREDGPAQTPEDYVAAVSATTGLPHALIRNSMTNVHHALTEVPVVLRGLTRGLNPALLDRGWGEQAGAAVSYYPVATRWASSCRAIRRA